MYIYIYTHITISLYNYIYLYIYIYMIIGPAELWVRMVAEVAELPVTWPYL